MADPLAEILNRVNANPQVAPPVQMPQAHWSAKLLGALGDLASNSSLFNLPKYAVNVVTQPEETLNKAVDQTRMEAGQLARVPTDVVGGITVLPNLPDTLSQVIAGKKIGRFETLDSAADAIHSAGQSVGEAIAGKPLNDSLIRGTPEELGASWMRLLTGAALPIPGTWQAKMSSALQKVSSGNAAADAIAAGAVKTMEVLTPLTLNPKAVVPNVAIASTIAPALELAVANHQQAAADLQKGSEATKGALDVAGQGAMEAREASAQRTIQAGMLPSITGDDTTDAIISAGLLSAAVFAQGKYNIAGRILKGTKKALTSYDPKNPLDATELGTWDLFEQQARNRNRGMEVSLEKALKERKAPNVKQQVNDFAESSAMRTGASVDTRMKSAFIYGELPDSAVKIRPINDWYVLHGQLDDAEKQLLDRALIAHRERDTRKIQKVWHDLYTTNTRDLEAYITQARANPRIRYLMDDYLETNRALAKYMDEQKRFSSKEIKQFQSMNPNYVAANITKDGGRWLDRREVKMNGGLDSFEKIGSPSQLWPQYIDEVFRSTEGKKIQRDFLSEMIRGKDAGFAYESKLIGRTVSEKPAGNSAGYFVHWRNSRGESRWTEVNDAAVRDSLNNATNPTALQLHKGLASVTRLYESGAVGTAAAVTGSVFAPKSAIYARTFGSAFRPKGIATSPLDKFMQTLTNGKMGVPEPFTALPMDIWNAVNGVAAVLIQRGAQSLHNSVLRQGPVARSLDAILPAIPIGPNTAKAAADGLATLYKRSGAHELQQRGLIGPGTFMSVDPALSYREAEKVLRANGLMGGLRETSTFVSDILHAITSAPAVTTMQLNRGKNVKEVSNAIRNMSGDPGASGAFRNASGAAAVVNFIPWGNIFIQSGFRLIDGFKKNPSGAVAGITTTAMMPELMSGMWNASLGAEYVDYQYMQRTPDQVASSIYIGIPGRLPSEGVEIPIDPWLRPFKGVAAYLGGAYLGLLDGSLYKPENSLQLQAIKDAVNHRFLGSPMENGTLPNSIMAQTIMPPVPGPLAAAGAMAGVQVRNWNDVRPLSEKHNAGFTEGTGPKGSMFLDKWGPAHLEDIVRGIGAQFGANVYTMLNETLTRRFSEQLGRNETNQSPKEAVKQGFIANVEQKLKDSGRMFGTGSLFDNALAISPAVEAAGTLVSGKLDGLRKAQEAFAASTLPGGTSQTVIGDKKRGFQEYMGVAPVDAPDDTLNVLGREATRIYQELSTAYGGARKDLFDQRQSIAQSSRYSPQLKRYMMNEIADQIIQLDRRMLVDIERREAVISQQLGVPVKFDKLNLNRGSEQFK